MENLGKDLRYALRSLCKRPGFTLIVLLTLALGIGANTAIFSVIHAVLLAPLPYRQAEQLVVLTAKNEKTGISQRPVSSPNLKDWQGQNQVFEHLVGLRAESFSLTDRQEPERVGVLRASTNILSLLGIKPLLGRDFSPEEEQPGKEAVALINYNLWRQRYAGDPHLVGKQLTLDGKVYTVIGILPRELKHPGRTMPSFPPTGPDVWIPLIPNSNEQNRNFANLSLIARLKPGVSMAQAQSDMNLVVQRLERQYPDSNANLGVELAPLQQFQTGQIRRALWILLGAVGCVLLIACANVANLLLARAAGRQAELAVRTALGASRWRLLRQLLTECLMLSFSGGALGLLLAAFGVPLLTSLSASRIPRVDEIGISLPVLLFTALVSLLTGLIFGLAPALHSSDFQLVEALKEGKKGATGTVRSRRWLNSLVIAELALALVLLTCAGLMIRSFRSVSAIDLGFDPHNLLTIAVPLPPAAYKDQTQQLQFYERAFQKLDAVPGVLAAGCVFRVPLFTGVATVIFTVEGQPVPLGQEPSADYRPISPGYFEATKMRLLKGRAFTARDNAEAADAVVVNEELAQRFFPNENPIGKRLQVATEKTRWREIVGVVTNAKLAGVEAPPDPAIYLPLPQNTWPNAVRNSSLVIRTAGDPNNYRNAIRAALRTIDPALALTQMKTMEEILTESVAQRRFNTALLMVFALIAGLLAAVGIYGVMSYLVTQRTHEVGIRMALGAQRRDIVKLVAGDGAKLVVTGIALGLALTVSATRLLAGLLYGVSAFDPVTFIATALLLASVAILAAYWPARRAAGTDPLVALRND